MRNTASFREYLRELRRLSEPFWPPVEPTQQHGATGTEPQRLASLMCRDYEAFISWVAQAYEELGQSTRQEILPKLLALQEQADQAYHHQVWPMFQATLVEAKALILQAKARQDATGPIPIHWVYRSWSRVLDAEVWFVHCEEEVAQLARQGVQRGGIYTEAELAELLRLPQPSSQTLKDLHLVKAFFNATVVPMEDVESSTGETPSGPRAPHE